MENLIPHIENLLIKNDYVIIPNFGGFVVQSESAQITDGKITPPVSVVGFNPLMRDQDGLLALEIVKAENISYREAVKMIEKETENFKLDLQKKEKITFGKLGFLSQSKENQIYFEPVTDSFFLPVNFGLKPINTTKFQTKKPEKITITLPTRRVFQYTAIILILLGVFLVSPQLNDSSISDYAALVPAMTLQSVPDLSMQEEAETTEITEIMVEEEQTLQQEITNKEYHIVVACLSDMASAELYCESLKKSSYESAHVLPSVKTNRVIIESFQDHEAAVVYMRNLRLSNEEFKDAWLHQQN